MAASGLAYGTDLLLQLEIVILSLFNDCLLLHFILVYSVHDSSKPRLAWRGPCPGDPPAICLRIVCPGPWCYIGPRTNLHAAYQTAIPQPFVPAVLAYRGLHSLTFDTALNSFVISRPDYCRTFLWDSPRF